MALPSTAELGAPLRRPDVGNIERFEPLDEGNGRRGGALLASAVGPAELPESENETTRGGAGGAPALLLVAAEREENTDGSSSDPAST